MDDIFLLTDIGFNEAGGGGGGSGPAAGESVPDASIYEADGADADLSPGYDPFGSATGIATVADTSYTQALELTAVSYTHLTLPTIRKVVLSFVAKTMIITGMN